MVQIQTQHYSTVKKKGPPKTQNLYRIIINNKGYPPYNFQGGAVNFRALYVSFASRDIYMSQRWEVGTTLDPARDSEGTFLSLVIWHRGDPWLHPCKLTWHWKIPIFNRKNIFKWWSFHCHVSFRRGSCFTNQKKLDIGCLDHFCSFWHAEFFVSER